MPEYSLEYSKRKMKAVRAMVAEIQKITELKKQGGKALLAKHGYRGNQPKMALRGLRSFLTSEDKLFADLLEQWESGKRSPFKLAEGVRQRTEKIGANEVILHSDTIHHANPLELADALDEMEPDELADLLTEEFEVKGEAHGDSKLNTRGQSYTTRGHLGQTTNPRGRYKATNEYSEPGLTEVSAHPRGANDPEMKAPDVKPRTRAEAREFLDSKAPIIQESRALGAYADRDVRALTDQKLIERGIIQPGQTIYSPDVSDETLKTARTSLDNLADEIDIAKAFKTPNLQAARGIIRFAPSVGLAIGANLISERVQAGDFEGAAGEGVAAVVGEVPIAGDILVTEAEGRAAGSGSAVPQGMTGQEYTQQQVEEAKTSKNFQQKVANEVVWAANNPSEVIQNLTETGLTTALSAGKAALDNPMLQPYTTPLKAIGGVIKLFQ